MSETFDYTAAVRTTCEDIAYRIPEFRHVRMARVAVSFCQTRNSSDYGVFASLTPLRFEAGERTMQKYGRTWTTQRLLDREGNEYLYLLNIYAPRFMDLKLSDKLDTIIHELYHISPEFNGDLRRFRGRCFAHGSSRKNYDATVRKLVEKWLATNPPPEVWDYLRLDFAELKRRFKHINGMKVPAPKLIPSE